MNKPNQWLAQYLHRHNPKYRDLKLSDELMEKISKSPSIVQNNNQKELRNRGTIIVFPSFLEHQVTPVTKGTRYSLVQWYSGPDWR